MAWNRGVGDVVNQTVFSEAVIVQFVLARWTCWVRQRLRQAGHGRGERVLEQSFNGLALLT